MDGVFFTAAAGAKIAAAVRRLESLYGNLTMPGKGPRHWDNEYAIDGVCDGACGYETLGICIPNIPVGDEGTDGITFWNALADIDDGAQIVIVFSHRSATDATRNHGDDDEIPTPWILGPATCAA